MNDKKCHYCFIGNDENSNPNFEAPRTKNFVPTKERVYKVFVKKIVCKYLII